MGDFYPKSVRVRAVGSHRGGRACPSVEQQLGGLFISLLFWANTGLLWEVPGLQKTGASDLGNLPTDGL